MKFSVYQRTEQGGRKKNEDRMGYVYTPQSALFVVTDGMGGHANGDLAAQIAIETLTELFSSQAHPILTDASEFLSKGVLQAHHQILHFSNERGMSDAPRTTLVALLLQEGRATWVHCGDSRLYWLRDGGLVKRTLDHSYAEQNPYGDNASADYLAKVTNRNVLFTCLGSPSKPIFDVSPSVPVQHGDKFLLCSDGLWGDLTDKEMINMLGSTTVVQSVPRLIDLALQRGGPYCDNVTGIGIEWLEAGLHKAADKTMIKKLVFKS